MEMHFVNGGVAIESGVSDSPHGESYGGNADGLNSFNVKYHIFATVVVIHKGGA
jgi:hypothetical protein